MAAQVFEILKDVGNIEPEIHFLTELGFIVDFAYPGFALAVEVDGPYHFDPILLDDNGVWEGGCLTKLNSFSMYKQKVLEETGWTVVRIPLYDWLDLFQEPEKVRAFSFISFLLLIINVNRFNIIHIYPFRR